MDRDDDLTGAPNLPVLTSGAADDQPGAGGGGWPWVLSDLKSLLETGTAFSRDLTLHRAARHVDRARRSAPDIHAADALVERRSALDIANDFLRFYRLRCQLPS